MAQKNRTATLLFFLAGMPLLLTAASPVNIEMVPGFAGTSPAGSWIPLMVRLESSSSFSGELRLSLPLGNPHLLKRNQYEVVRRITLEPGVPLRLPFTLPLPRREDLTLILTGPDHEEQRKIYPLHPSIMGVPLVLGLSRRPDIGLGEATGYRYQTVHPESLPAAAEGYSSLGAVVLHDAPLQQISPAQTEALISWIRSGGILVTLGQGGLPENLGPLLTPLVPLTVFGRDGSSHPPELPGTAVFPLPPAPSYPLFRGSPSGDARTLPASSGMEEGGTHPLQAFRREGRGYTVSTLIDPTELPYRRWEGLKDYWRVLLEPFRYPSPPAFPLEDPLPALHSQLTVKLGGSGGPRISLIMLYLSPLGLLGFFLFRRKTRGNGIFFVLALLLGNAVLIALLYPVSPRVYREIQVVHRTLEGEPALQWIKGGISGRREGMHRITLPRDVFTPLPNLNESLLLEEDGFSRILLLEQPPWEGREFFFSAPGEAYPPGTLSFDGSSVSGFIPWNLREDWTDPLLLGGSGAVTNGVLLPDGEGVSFRLSLGRGAAAREEELNYRKEQLQKLSSFRRALLDYVVYRQQLGREDDDAAFYLIAFSRSRDSFLTPEGTQAETESILLMPLGEEAWF